MEMTICIRWPVVHHERWTTCILGLRRTTALKRGAKQEDMRNTPAIDKGHRRFSFYTTPPTLRDQAKEGRVSWGEVVSLRRPSSRVLRMMV